MNDSDVKMYYRKAHTSISLTKENFLFLKEHNLDLSNLVKAMLDEMREHGIPSQVKRHGVSKIQNTMTPVIDIPTNSTADYIELITHDTSSKHTILSSQEDEL